MATTTELDTVVNVDPEILSGVPVFRGTRVPVVSLFDYLSSGDSLEEFLEDFPSVSPDLAAEAIAEAGRALIARRGPRTS
jgi:uncharacterized protein (DUF433 family)